jgi:prepilin-type N-terminal cleavage/methylation domain-containing protein
LTEDRVRLLRNRRGFTLIEALVVVSILGVMATFAVPAVERTLLSNKADRAAAIVVTDVQNAMGIAARQRKPVRISFGVSPYRMNVRDRVTNALMYRRYYGQGVSPYGVTYLAATQNPFFVFPNGIVNGAVTITLRVGPHERRISVSRVGQIRVQGS